MNYECRKINNHNGTIVVDDCIMEKPYIKQNYSGVEFHSTPVSFQHLATKSTSPIPLISNDEFLIQSFKIHLNGCQWFFFQVSIKRPLNAMTNGLVVVDIKDS